MISRRTLKAVIDSSSSACSLVHVHNKWLVLKFEEPSNSFSSPFKVESNVLVDDRPN